MNQRLKNIFFLLRKMTQNFLLRRFLSSGTLAMERQHQHQAMEQESRKSRKLTLQNYQKLRLELLISQLNKNHKYLKRSDVLSNKFQPTIHNQQSKKKRRRRRELLARKTKMIQTWKRTLTKLTFRSQREKNESKHAPNLPLRSLKTRKIVLSKKPPAKIKSQREKNVLSKASASDDEV